MRIIISFLILLNLPLAAEQTKKPLNVLLICVDDLRPELNCYGKDYIKSPNIDKLASGGIFYTRHYVHAPTCGASRYALLTGLYGRKGMQDNGALFKRANNLAEPPEKPSLPRYFKDNGYNTVSVGKVSHHPGGRGGKDWDDDEKHEMPGAWTRHLQPSGAWQHPRGIMHGLANGEIRNRPKEMAVYQAVEGGDEIYPDGLTINTALKELKGLAKDEKPFFLAVGILRPHLPFGAPKKYLDMYDGVKLPEVPHPGKPEGKTTWHGSGEFMKYNRWGRNPNTDAEFSELVRRHYAACVSYADAQVGRLMQALKDEGIEDNTIVVLWGDHGWHLGEHAVWGKHTLFEESLRSPLIIRYPGMNEFGEINDVVQTIDIYPTLCVKAGLHVPKWLDGKFLRTTQSTDFSLPPQPAISYQAGKITIRTDRYRLVAYNDGYNELYDHSTDPGETKNVAKENEETVEKLRKLIQDRMGS